MTEPRPTELRRQLAAARNSMKGLWLTWTGEAAFRVEVALAFILVPAGAVLGQNGVEKAMLIAPVFLVLITELLNSAIEAAIDRIGEEHHPLAGRAKDCGSAAVFLAICLTVFVWVLILWHYWNSNGLG